MSQHVFETVCGEESVLVMMGWDRPLHGFFLEVSSLDSEDDELYSHMLDPDLVSCNGMSENIEYFVEKLRFMEISVPDLMIQEVLSDALDNVGNRMVRYAADGTIQADTLERQRA